jgi:hypothetical protein
MISLLLGETPPGKLKHLDLHLPSRHEISHDFELAKLQTLRLRDFYLQCEVAERVLEPSVLNKTLHTFTLQWPKIGLSTNWAEIASHHLSSHAWLRGSESIRSLTIRGFSFGRWDDPVSGEFPTFIGSFPNLEELSLQDSMFEDQELCVIIGGILKACKGLKVLWQSQVKGVLMDQLIEVGRKADVDIRAGEIPKEWPVKLVEDTT